MHIQNAGCPTCRGLEQQVALPRDSYLQHYFADVTSVMRVGPPLFFVVSAVVAWLLCACMPSTCHAPGALCVMACWPAVEQHTHIVHSVRHVPTAVLHTCAGARPEHVSARSRRQPRVLHSRLR